MSTAPRVNRQTKSHAGREKPTGAMKLSFVAGFDYAQLPDDKRQRIEQATARVRDLHTRMASDAVELGRVLTAVYQDLGPRLFTVWRAAEFHLSQGTCSNLMMIAERFGDLDCLNRFQPSALYELGRARVPDQVKDEAIERARSGEEITKVRALELIERHEVAADREHTPVPRRDELGRLKSNLRVALARWPDGDRRGLAEKLIDAVRDVLSEFDLADLLEPPAIEPARTARDRSRPSASMSRAAAAAGVALLA
ncbi:MAG TPA: hypothetical protein VFH56_17110 [Acidimicrobiales bacterium]|nr:hypothetical protein [Acidimicrobiales bacterium]